MEIVNKGDMLIYSSGRECFVTGVKEELFHAEILRTIYLSDNALFIMDSTDRLSDWVILPLPEYIYTPTLEIGGGVVGVGE